MFFGVLGVNVLPCNTGSPPSAVCLCRCTIPCGRFLARTFPTPHPCVCLGVLTLSSPKKRRGQPWTDAVSPRLKAAVDQLAGTGTWEMFGCGWWAVTFPGFAIPPWRADGKWHVDGAHFRHYPHRWGKSCPLPLFQVFHLGDREVEGPGSS